MEFEQQFHDLEQRYMSLKSEYDLCRAENTAHAGEWHCSDSTSGDASILHSKMPPSSFYLLPITIVTIDFNTTTIHSEDQSFAELS